MLEIRVNNESLDLGKVTITFELLSPIFNDIGSFSYPFALPATSKNKSLFGFPGRINSQNRVISVKATIFVDGIFFRYGNLVITDSSEYYIKAYFAVKEGYFFSESQNTQLKDVEMGGVRQLSDYMDVLDPDTMFQNVINAFYPDFDFTLFPVKNIDFFKDLDDYSLINNKVNYYNPANGFNHGNNVLTLFPYLSFVLKSIFEQYQVNLITNDLYNDVDLRQLVLFNNNPLNKYFSTGFYQYLYLKIQDINLQGQVPDATIGELLSALEETFACYFFYNDSTNSGKLKLLKNILDDPAELLDFQYRFSSIDNTDDGGYAVDWKGDTNDEAFDVKENNTFNYKGSVAYYFDLPATAAFRDLYYSRVENAYYIFREKSDGTSEWKKFTTNLNFKSGDGERIIKPTASLAYNAISPFETMICQKLGNHNLGEDEANETPVRFMFWRGYQDLQYQPVGSVQSLNQVYRLNWHGSDGLYEQFWKKPLSFLANTTIADLKMILDIATLKNLDFSKKYRFANANWLLSSVKIQVSNNKISPAEITAYKV